MQAPLSPYGSTPAELRERLALESRGTAFLAWRDDAGHQCLAVLDEDRARFTVGRGPENDVALTWDSRTSRVHAIVERAGGEWLVVDDGLSQNGTWIGAERVSGHRRLRHRDVLRVGETLIAFSDPVHASTSATSRGHDLLGLVDLTALQHGVLVALCRPFADGATFAAPATNQEIGAELHLSVEAIKTHLRTLFRKFSIADVPQNQKRLQLAQAALRAGVVTERDLRP
jgi:DNA-binding CsgD family transcriptional regulator